MPGPAGGEVQCPAACVSGQAAGDLDEPAAQGARGADGCGGQSEQLGPSEHVVRERAKHGPGAVGVKVTGGEVRERLVFEVGDDLLDDGVLAVLGLDDRDVFGAVGDQTEVPPVGPQLGLGAHEAGAADDQPAAVVGGFGDLRLTVVGVGDGLPGGLVDRFDGGADGLDRPHPD